MAIKLLTLNIEGDRHLSRIHAAITAHLPDIACLQEVFEADCPYLASMGYDIRYAVSARVAGAPGRSPERNWGVAVLSRLPVRRQTTTYYAEDSRIQVIQAPNDARRVLVVTELEHLGQPYRIATTHFTWSPDGHINDHQKADFSRLEQVLSRYSDYVLCGDFNAPRGREMFARFTDGLNLCDHLPASVTTTLDARFHRAGALDLVVDTIFSTQEYRVTGVQVLEGISDHKGILAVVERMQDSTGERSQR
jgi:endonuclease/exonuclease/phosphatase family metal-dependent hydrolase